MVCVYDIGNENFNGMGNAVLMPTDGRMRQAAGGSYDLTMTHPIDPQGKWEHLVPDAIIQIPVPEEVIENAFTGTEQWIYTANQQIVLREGPSEPTTVTYPEWYGTTDYTAGSSCVSYNGRNYKCVTFDTGSGERFVPPNNSSWWREISRTSGGSAAVATIPAGTRLWWISGSNSDTWWKMSTEWGVEGYCKQSLLTLDEHLLPEETEARVIRTQLFRITSATIDTAEMTVSVEAEHVSYDLRGNIVKEAAISGASPANAVYKVISNLMMELKGQVATNLTSSENGTYTGTFRGKNGIFCLLDPDNGLAGAFDAAVKRDNWDIFLLKKTHPDRGFRLRYRKNARGINWSRSRSSVVTRVVPVAKDSDGSELYLDNPFVDSPYIERYPVIRMEKLQVSGQVGKDDGSGTGATWTKAGLQEEMQAKAEERFSVDQSDRVAEEVTVDFTVLGDTEDYPELKHLEKALLYDRVRAIDERVGLEILLDVTEIEWDFIHCRLTALTLSNVSIYSGKATVSGYTVQNSSITAEKLDASVLSSIYSAQAKMEQWLLSLQSDDGNLRTTVQVTEAGIRADMTDSINGLSHTLEVTAAGIRSDMADEVDGLQATITATAAELRSDYQTADGNLQTSITQNANAITLEAQARADGDNTLDGKITVEAGKITQIVTAVGDDGEVTAASIVLAINQSSGDSEARIDAQHVYIGNTDSVTYIAGQLQADRARITTLETDYLQTANLKAEIGDITGLKVLGITTDNTSGFASFPDIIASRSLTVDGVNCFSLPDGVKEIRLYNQTGTTTYELQYKTYRNTVQWQSAGSFSLAAAQSYAGTWSGDNTGDTATYTVTESPGGSTVAQSSLVLHINSQAAWVTDPNGTIRARLANTQYEDGWIAAANAVVAPAAATGEVLAFSVTVPANTGAGDTTTVDFGITKGTPSASGGFAAVTYGNRVVGRISLDDWWDGGFDAVSLSQAWATGDTGASNQLTVSADAKTDGTVRRRTFSLGLEAAGWSSGSNNVQLRSNGSVVAHLNVSIPANSTAGWDNAYLDGDYYVSGNLGGRVLSYTFSGSEAYRDGWEQAEDDFSAPTTTPASLGNSVTITGPNSTVDGTPVSITYTLSADSNFIYLKYGANTIARAPNPGGGAMALAKPPTWANTPGSTGTSVTWGTSNTVTVQTADGNDSVSIGLYMTQGSTWTDAWIRNTYIRLDSASGRYVAKMPVDASGVYEAGRTAVTIAGLSWTTGSNSSSTRQMRTSTSGRGTESTYDYELVLKNGSDNDTVILTVDNLSTSAAAMQRMAYTHGKYTAGWRAAYGVWKVPAAGTAATCTFTFPAYANDTTLTRTYTLSEDNSYAYLKDPNGNTVARVSNGAYQAGYSRGYELGEAAGMLKGWHAYYDDTEDWVSAYDEGGGVYSVWIPKREPPSDWIGGGTSATCEEWFRYSTAGSHSPSASGASRQAVAAGDSFISGCRHLTPGWTEPSTGGMYYKFTVTCGGSSAKYYFKV